MQSWEILIQEIIQKYGITIWITLFGFFITGFIAFCIKNFIADVANYLTTKMSDLGYGAMIIWDGQLKRVIEINFKNIKVMDDEEIKYIPIEVWLKSVKTYPQPRKDEFDEKKWKEKPWDGRTERRKYSEGE